MKYVDRLVSFIGGILLFIISIIMIILATPYHGLLDYYWTSAANVLGALETGLIGIIVLLISIRLVWYSVKREKKINSVSKEMDLGEVKIALDTIESLAMQVANQTRGIKDVSTKIKAEDEGIVVFFKGKVLSDVVIPQLSEQLQYDIKEYIESISGITVLEVKMLIENVAEERGKNLATAAKSKSASIIKGVKESRLSGQDEEGKDENVEETLSDKWDETEEVSGERIVEEEPLDEDKQDKNKKE